MAWRERLGYVPRHRPLFTQLPERRVERWRLVEEFIDTWHKPLKPGDGASEEELRAKTRALRPLLAEMRAAGVLIFTGGLDDASPVFSVDASSGTPLFTDGPYVESKEHLGGFAVVDVADEEAARLWAGKIAVACGWPQEVRRFLTHRELLEDS